MQRNQLFEKTEDQIKQAFMDMLQQKLPEKITVADIIREGNISRSTFYEHYPDGMPELMNAMRKEDYISLKQFFKEVMNGERSVFDKELFLYKEAFKRSRKSEYKDIFQNRSFILYLDEAEDYLIEQYRKTHNSNLFQWKGEILVRSYWGSIIELLYYNANTQGLVKEEKSAIEQLMTDHIRQLFMLCFSEDPTTE